MFIIVTGVFLIALIGVLFIGQRAMGRQEFKNEILKGEYSDDKNLLSDKYSTDASWFCIEPSKVYFPKTVSEVQEITKSILNKKKQGEDVSLSVRAGGTCMSGGSLTKDTVIDMTKYLNKVTVDVEKKTATVEGGAYFRDIEDTAKKHGLMFPAFPSSHRVCGIGGMIGNNASGEKSLRGGATVDNVLELQMVMADGSVQNFKQKSLTAEMSETDKAVISLYDKCGRSLSKAVGRVKKNASGYRLDRVVNKNGFNAIPLFVGAQGTLGIVTKAVLKLSPIPKYTELVIVSANNLNDLPNIINTAFSYNPESLETFDINTFNKAKEHLSEHAKHLLTYIDEEAKLFILAQFSEDSKEATISQAEKFSKDIKDQGYTVSRVTKILDVMSAWQVRRNSFLLMRDYNPKGFRAMPCIEDVIVPLDKIGEFIAELTKILETHTEHYGFHGHIGDGSLRIIPVFDFTKPDVLEKIFTLMRETFALVKRLEGNISADHSDGFIRTPFLKEFYGEDIYSAFEELKKVYDPYNIMNPNKKVNGSLDLIKKYLR